MERLAKRAIVLEDLYSLKCISDPQVSPDSSKIAFVVKTVDSLDREKY